MGEDRSPVNQFVLFLRAINTGTRRVTNEQLLVPLMDAGFVDVRAFQAAGNLILRADGSEDVELDARALTALLNDAYGFDTPVFLRSADALRSVTQRSPFTPDQLATTAGKVQVTFMTDEPSVDQIAAVAELTPTEDLIHFDGREWFWLPVDGVSGSTLPVKRIERIVGPMTMRTLGTVQRIVDKISSEPT